jgi:predicted protein tyrosine phosphatase
VKVFVLDEKLARDFVPDNPTLAVRIFDSFPPNDGKQPLQDSNNWIQTLNYWFDDIEVDIYPEEYRKKHLPIWREKYNLFNKCLAKKLVDDFRSFQSVDQIMLHCHAGWSRSPAVILGLQQVFNLDIAWAKGRTKRIMEAKLAENSVGNTHVYNLIVKAGE